MITATSDIGLFADSNGGNMDVLSNDLNTTESLYQVIYISLFGGNIEGSTLGNEPESDERFDFWGNSLLFSEIKDKQFNSETQKTLSETVLNSSGRLKIKQSVENDLVFLKNIVNFEVSVFVESYSRVVIGVNVISLSNDENKLYQLVWDNARNEVITNEDL